MYITTQLVIKMINDFLALAFHAGDSYPARYFGLFYVKKLPFSFRKED
jgi:hypothetical protein